MVPKFVYHLQAIKNNKVLKQSTKVKYSTKNNIPKGHIFSKIKIFRVVKQFPLFISIKNKRADFCFLVFSLFSRKASNNYRPIQYAPRSSKSVKNLTNYLKRNELLSDCKYGFHRDQVKRKSIL